MEVLMKPVAKGVSSLLTSLLVVGFTAPNQAWGQPIQAASDGTGTVVIPNGNRYDIQKGIRSPDGTNLFHSFERFGLSDGQIANFLSSPEIRNILGRVVGKEPSVINGLIQVTGGNSNLFLMNPAGILFGAGASLNVPASFTATTATGIGFGGNNWFHAFGINTYENLIGNPNEFAFDFSQLGRIENEGNLTVGAGQSLTLLGGSVKNKGEVTAPGGDIIIWGVEGEKLVRISQPGQVLSLEISPPRDSSGQVLPVQPMDLPAMLTGNGGQVRNQGQVSANSSNAGSVNVTGTVVYNLGQITADGVNGGRIQIDSKNLLDSGILSASGSDGRGGEIQVKYTGTLIQTASALTSATGTQEGGTIAFYGGKNTVLTTSGSFEATGDLGGFVHLFGQDIRLLAADVNVSGNRGGGEILVGGNVQGNPLNPPSPGGIVNAQNTLVNYSSILRADALTVGNAGKVIVWSDQLTQFAGTIQARGGAVRGGGGFVEVSGKDTLAMTGVVEAGAVNGQAGTLLLDPKNIVIDQTDTTGLFPQFDLIDPNVGGGTGFGSSVVPLSTGNVVVTKPGDNFAADNAGAVYLYNGATGGLISVVTGTQANDQVGSGGVFALSNGNYVVSSDLWNGNRGAATWGNGSIGISGQISGVNSLVGTQANDQVSSGGITALSNGNYVVSSYNWNGNRGAATWGNGSIGISGEISAANSLVGTQPSDYVGDYAGNGITALSNGNYVVGSSFWNGNRGAVTWGNGNIGISGEVSAANSLVGTQVGDSVGLNITALSNGNYVVSSSYWNGNRGVATWGNGSTGISGEVSAANSLVGTQPNDYVGSAITPLSNGNYVVGSRFWNGNRGAATWGNGSIGISGVVSAANSLVGTQPNDLVGNGGIIALSNGNYVVRSSNWNGFRGAVIWGDGTTGRTFDGTNLINPQNSILGRTASAGLGTIVEDPVNGTFLVPFVNEGSGRVTVAPSNPTPPATPIFNPDLFRFTSDPSATVTLSPGILWQTLSAGTSVVLQANNDITVNSPIISSNPLGNGGNLSLQAGRSILVNGDIFTDNGNLTLIANETTANGVVNAQRDPGQAVISIAPGVTLNSGTGDTTLILGTGDGLTNNSGGEITVGNIITDGGDITLINNRGGINAISGILRTGSEENGGAIALSAAGNLTTNNIFTNGQNGKGGDIRLISEGIITTGILSSWSNDQGGDIMLQAAGNITTDDINANGVNGDSGDIHLTSGNDITTGILSTLGNVNGGDIILNAAGNITANSISSSGGNGDSGMIRLDSGGSINIIDASPINPCGIILLFCNANGGGIFINM